MSQTPQLEILDLRHFSSAQLAPLLRDEGRRWDSRMRWDYTKSTELLLEYVDGRVLPGYVALEGGRVVGYTFSVFEAAKAVIGDLYAFHEEDSPTNPICETLLHHLLETLQATPAVDRIEAQLLMFPSGSLAAPFFARGFRSHPRLFMFCDLNESPLTMPAQQLPLPINLRLQSYRPEFYDAAAELIHRAYLGHMDSGINDQYRTLHGAQRFLHNIIKFPGCGIFDAENSWLLRDIRTGRVEGVVLSSRVRRDVGHITQLCMSPMLRNLGLGHLLLRQCATEFRKSGVNAISLTVTEANHMARRLYDQTGFTTLHRFDAMVWDAE
jgi:ribosomal protein S18 acetylase RimI-like enzyme